MTRKSVNFLLVGLLLSTGCQATRDEGRPQSRTWQNGDMQMTVTVASDVLRIAEPCVVRIEVSADRPHTTIVPEIDGSANDFTLIEAPPMRSTVVDGQTTQTREFVLESYKSGQRSIPRFLVKRGSAEDANTANGSEALRSEPIPVRVLSSVSLFDDPRRYYDDVTVIDPPHGWLFYSIVAAFALLALLVLGTALRTMVRKMAVSPSPREFALRRLDSIDGRGRREQWSAAVTIDAVDAVLKQFLQRHWSLLDSGLTANELLREAQWHWRFDEPSVARLRSLLQAADRVRFGQFRATPQMAELALDATRELIIATDEASFPIATRREDICHV